MKLKLITVLSVLIFLAACKATKMPATNIPAISYTNYVEGIIDANCANSCHNAERPAGGIDLTIYVNVKEQALNGKLIPAIQHAEGAKPMPKKNPKLDDPTIQKIVEWAAAGAPE